MIVIRLFRVGKKNQPAFKIVVADKKNPPKAGRFVEEVGFWNPLTKEKIIKGERVKYWLSVGAKPSATLHNLLISEKIIEGKKIPKHKKPKKVAVEEKPSAAPAKPAAEPEKKPVSAEASTSDKSASFAEVASATKVETADKSAGKEEKAEEASQKPAEGK
jgi:small subunit ribosomal protein S16